MPAVRHIAIEGGIGAGKTSLAHLLAADLEAREVLEIVEENPFLTGGFYLDPQRFSFDTQMFFLLSRLRQQRELKRLLAQGDTRVVADYFFDKDNIFASLNLSPDDYALYGRVFRTFRAELTTPDLIVYLRAPTALLVERIRRRGRAFEQTIRESYVEALTQAYEEYFASFAGPAHVTVDVSRVDWTRSPEDYRAVLDLVTQTIANITAGQGAFEFVREPERERLTSAAAPSARERGGVPSGAAQSER